MLILSQASVCYGIGTSIFLILFLVIAKLGNEQAVLCCWNRIHVLVWAEEIRRKESLHRVNTSCWGLRVFSLVTALIPLPKQTRVQMLMWHHLYATLGIVLQVKVSGHYFATDPVKVVVLCMFSRFYRITVSKLGAFWLLIQNITKYIPLSDN